MTKVSVIAAVILVIIASVLAYLFYESEDEATTVNTVPTATPTPTSAETSLPTGWIEGEDETLKYSFAYPEEFDFQPATSESAESAFYSFDTTAAPGQGGIPPEELKIAVVLFTENSTRDLSFEESTVTATESTTVDGRTATRRTIEGGAGGSISTTVETENGTYLISAYPPNSEQLHIYNEFLTHVTLSN